MSQEDKKEMMKLLEGKLRMPIHISYIAKYILKKTQNETKDILDIAISEGMIEESSISKGYYVLKHSKK